jgi:hypothetical protein
VDRQSNPLSSKCRLRFQENLSRVTRVFVSAMKRTNYFQEPTPADIQSRLVMLSTRPALWGCDQVPARRCFKDCKVGRQRQFL